MKIIFERPKLFGGFTDPVEMDNIPRIGDRVVLDDGKQVVIYYVEWYPFGSLESECEEDKQPMVYVGTKKL